MKHNWTNYRKMGIAIEYLERYIKLVNDLYYFDYPIKTVREYELKRKGYHDKIKEHLGIETKDIILHNLDTILPGRWSDVNKYEKYSYWNTNSSEMHIREATIEFFNDNRPEWFIIDFSFFTQEEYLDFLNTYKTWIKPDADKKFFDGIDSIIREVKKDDYETMTSGIFSGGNYHGHMFLLLHDYNKYLEGEAYCREIMGTTALLHRMYNGYKERKKNEQN